MNQLQQFIEYVFNAIKIWVIVQPWESGIRVRMGKHVKKLNKGIHFKIPYFDSVYVQEVRLRVMDMSIQTLTTKDMKTITLKSAMGYSIIDVEKLYRTLYTPEGTLQNIAMSTIAEVVQSNNAVDITPKLLEDKVIEILDAERYGIDCSYLKINNFAMVRTYRLIQDSSWTDTGYAMDRKK